MKLERLIEIGDDRFEIKYSYLGSEKYYLNGELFEKRWNLDFKGKRFFQINGNELMIDISITPANYHCKAYLNGELLIEELFPEFRKKVEKGGFLPRTLKNVIAWLVLSAIFLAVFEKFQGTP